MINMLAFSVVALVVSVNVGAAASLDVADRKDFQLLKDVATSVDRYTQFTIFDDVSARVKDGYVTLSGKVTMPFKRDDIVYRVSEIEGVRQVNDRITVLPVSIFDDELRALVSGLPAPTSAGRDGPRSGRWRSAGGGRRRAWPWGWGSASRWPCRLASRPRGP